MINLSVFAVNRSVDVVIPGKTSNYNLINGGQFKNGLVLDNQRVDNEIVKIDISSILPSGEVKQSQYEVSPGTLADGYILVPKQENIGFKFRVQKVDTKGQPISGQFMPIFQKNKNLGFLPLLKGFISDVSDINQTGGDIQIPLGVESNFFGILDTMVGGKNIVSGAKFVLKAFLDGSDIHLKNIDLEKAEESNRTLSGYLTTTSRDFKNKKTTPKLSRFGNIPDIELVLTSLVKYTINGKNVVYPGGNLGSQLDGTDFFDLTNSEKSLAKTVGYNDSSMVSVLTAGVDIEGVTLGENIVYDGANTLLNVGDNKQKDVRESILRNAYSLVRGVSSKPINTSYILTLTDLDFTDEKVKYYEFDKSTSPNLLVLDLGSSGNSVSGVGTLVVKNANILIKSDLKYTDLVNDSLGVILLTDDVTSAVNDNVLGNLFIDKNVKKFVGTYFVENSLIGTDKITPVVADSGSDDSMINQLLLEGTILSKNTLGGSLVEFLDGGGKYLTPWGKINDENLARKYDLHKFRYYVGKTDGSGNALNNVVDDPNCVPDKKNTSICDKNKHAFVIRPDGKVKNQTPPGFKF